MKAERRHELRENDLHHALLQARAYLDEHSKEITIVAVVALLVFGGASFALRARTTAYEDLWRRKQALSFDGADAGRKSLESLAALSRDASDPEFVLGALLEQGRQALRLTQSVPFPPDRQFNNDARNAFNQLLERFPNNPLAVGTALTGLATVEENEFLLDHDPAHKNQAREHLTKAAGDSRLNGLPFQRIALDRLKKLDDIFVVYVFEPPPPPPPDADVEPVDPAAGQPAANP